MSEFGYRPDIKKAVNLTGITALKSQLRINILALGIPTIIEGQTCGKDIICIFYPWFSFTSFDLSFAKKCPLNVRDMAGQDIPMNAFKLLTDAAYLYGEATDSSQGKIEKDVFINIVKRYITSIRSKGGIPDSDLNNIYKNEDSGISIYDIVTGILNSPATYSFCINIQRTDKGIVTASQRIIQIVPGDNSINLRMGKGDGEKIVYSSWRQI